MTREKVGTDDILQLLQRSQAKRQPILASQVRDFIDFPDGLAPRNCVGMQYISEIYGTDVDRAATKQCVYDLSVHPETHQVIFTTLCEGQNLIIIGDKEHRLLDYGPAFQFNTDGNLFGVTKEGQIGAVLWNTHRNRALLYFNGMTNEYDEIRYPTMLSDGSIIFSRYSFEDEALLILRQKLGEAVPTEIKRDSNYRHEMRQPERYCLSSSGDIYAMEEKARHSDKRVTILGKQIGLPNSEYIIDLVSIGRKMFFVKEFEGTTYVTNNLDGSIYTERTVITSPNNPYKRWLTRFGKGNWCWVGQSATGGRECWMIGTEPQPAFDKVSPLFLEQYGNTSYWEYYGLIDSRRQIYKMRLTSLQANKNKP